MTMQVCVCVSEWMLCLGTPVMRYVAIMRLAGGCVLCVASSSGEDQDGQC